MVTLSQRFTALLAALALLCAPSLSLAKQKEEASPVPYTSSRAIWNGESVVVTGTRAMVDHAYLRQVNPDYAGWLYQEETALSQPIMQCEKGWYLQRGFDEIKLNNRGSICLDAAASLEDPHVVLQGTGRKDSCFESLNGYTDQAYLEAHPSLRLLTPQGDWHAQVFAAIPTTQRSKDTWIPPAAQSEFRAWLSAMLEQSLIQPGEQAVPAFGDRLLILLVDNAASKRTAVLARLTPIEYETQSVCDLTKAELDRRETTSGPVEVGTLGQMQYYAQNDPLWNRMRYESEMNPTFRVFGDGGCGPTAAAIALANLVPAGELPLLAEYTKEPLGTLFCECSVNRVYCNHLHPPYRLQTAEEYLRYLPVAMADFATGNNTWNQTFRRAKAAGSSMLFLELVCEIFGIACTDMDDREAALALMKEKTGTGLLVCCALRGAYTNTSHYVVLAGVDDQYFYVLDPLCRTDYTGTDPRRIVELLAPGVTRVALENYAFANLAPAYYLERTK